MNARITNIKSRLANWREWELNPVLLKELRQAMRNRFLTSALMLLLAALFLALVATLARRSFLPEENPRVGLLLVRAFLVILTAITFVFVPLYVGIRLYLERRESDFDLMFITPLAPRRIVRGKLLCGIYLAGMFFSVCMPFMVFTNLLRGVDLPTIIVILIFLFEAVWLAIQSAILFGCFPIRTHFKILIGCLFSAGLLIAGCGVVALCFGMLRSGVPSIKSWDLWIWLAATFVLAAGGTWVLFLASVTFVTNDNRPRGYYGEIVKRQAMEPMETAESQPETAEHPPAALNPRTG